MAPAIGAFQHGRKNIFQPRSLQMIEADFCHRSMSRNSVGSATGQGGRRTLIHQSSKLAAINLSSKRTPNAVAPLGQVAAAFSAPALPRKSGFAQATPLWTASVQKH